MSLILFLERLIYARISEFKMNSYERFQELALHRRNCRFRRINYSWCVSDIDIVCSLCSHPNSRTGKCFDIQREYDCPLEKEWEGAEEWRRFLMDWVDEHKELLKLLSK